MTVTARIDTAALDALLTPYDSTHAPGFVLGVALKGTPVYRRGVGVASIELPLALSPSIRMRIGSTSKHFCALAVMLLAEEGRLSIEDSPRRVIPELPEWAEGISLRQLMAHTSGMRDSLDLIMMSAGPGRPGAADAQLKMLAALDSVNFAPGRSWNYNNGGYVLLTAVVERVSGQDLADFLRARIFEPIGMVDTQLRRLDTDLLPNSATLHLPGENGGWTRGVFGVPVAGEGGIVSTADDMLRWLSHMSNPIVGRPATWNEMRTPMATHGYGLGLNMAEHRGLKTVHHAGGVVGGSSQMLKVLDHELDLILMTNGQSAFDLYRLVDAVLDACFEGLDPAPVDAGGAPVAGVFYSASSGQVLTLSENEGGQALSVGGFTLPAKRDEAGRISVDILPTDLRITPVRDGTGVPAIDVMEFGENDRLLRIETPADAPKPIGAFDSPGAGLSALISAEGEDVSMRLTGALGATDYRLVPIGPDLWRGTGPLPMPMTVTLELDPTGFMLTSGRTVRLRFERRA